MLHIINLVSCTVFRVFSLQKEKLLINHLYSPHGEPSACGIDLGHSSCLITSCGSLTGPGPGPDVLQPSDSVGLMTEDFLVPPELLLTFCCVIMTETSTRNQTQRSARPQCDEMEENLGRIQPDLKGSVQVFKK